MNPRGELYSERVPGKGVRKFMSALEYQRSLQLKSIKLTMSLESRPTWATQQDLRSGFLKFDPRADDQVIKPCPSYGSYFKAHTLEKVNNSDNGDDKLIVGTDFYPMMHQMLQKKQDWENNFVFRGRSLFAFGVLEWTKDVLETFKETLYEADIYGAVAVSRYPYELPKYAWKAFCELWGSLSNTLHFADGEMDISLYDIKVIGGLPIYGFPYEEFLPTNTDLQNEQEYPPTVLELLRIHSLLCLEHKCQKIYWDQWLDHFYRGGLIYASFGDTKTVPPKARLPRSPLKVSKEGKLAAFLAFWLCRFVLPTWNGTIRPETFYMACLMAKGVKVSLAPTTLGYIYHCLGEVAVHQFGEKTLEVGLPIHYVIGWLGEYFPQTYSRRPDNDFEEDYPLLARYACVSSKDLSITCARMIFRDNRSVVYRPYTFNEAEGQFLIDDETLTDERFDFLLSLRSVSLPIRVDGQLFLEPYYPNRFARQFGYDQSEPSNRFTFSIPKRSQCSVEELAKAQIILYNKNTTARFYIPRSTYQGQCTWWYCRWWLKACTPYLGLSVSKIYKTFYKRSPEPEHRIFTVNRLAEISKDLRKMVKISPLQQKIHSSPSASNSKDKQPNASSSKEKQPSDILLKEKQHAPLEETGNVNKKSNHMKGNTQRIVKQYVPDFESVIISKPLDDAQNIDLIESDSSSSFVLPEAKLVTQPSKRKREESSSKACTQKAQKTMEKEIKKVDQKAVGSNKPSSSKCVPNGNDVEKILSSVLDPTLALFTKNYIIGHVSNIFAKVSFSALPKDLLTHVEDINLSLAMLRPVIPTLKSGKALLEHFTTTIDVMLRVAIETSRAMSLLQVNTEVDVEFVCDLISDYERCMKIKEDLTSRLAESSVKLNDLQAAELDILADEKRVQKRRQKHDSEKAAAGENVAFLKKSIQEQEEQGQSILKEKSVCMKEQLPEIEKVISSNILETKKYQESFDFILSLFSSE